MLVPTETCVFLYDAGSDMTPGGYVLQFCSDVPIDYFKQNPADMSFNWNGTPIVAKRENHRSSTSLLA